MSGGEYTEVYVLTSIQITITSEESHLMEKNCVNVKKTNTRVKI